MKILILSESLALGGGAERFAVTIGNQLQKKGHQIYYLTFCDSKNKYPFEGEYFTFNDGKSENFISKAVNFIKKPYKIKKICQKNDINAIISVGEGPNFKAILSKYFGNKSKIIVSHHLNPEIHFNNKLIYNEIKTLYPRADLVVCVSNAIENILQKKYGVFNTKTIYNMLDIKSCIERSKEEIPTEYIDNFNSDFIFVNVGRLSLQKGHLYLIESFKDVVGKYNYARLLILGDGELKSDLIKKVNELDLEQNVFFLGNQNNVFPFLQKSNAFVLSSLVEGFPLTLIETLSLGLPIISTDCKTGPRECLCPELDPDEEIKYPYFGKYGILTMPFDLRLLEDENINIDEALEMFKNIMIKMIEEPQLQKKYSNGLERAKNFNEDEIVDQWEEILKSA